MAKKQKNKNIEIIGTIKPDYSKVKTFTEKGDFERHIDMIKWGTGVQKAKKGKGSYNRKEKHKNKTLAY